MLARVISGLVAVGLLLPAAWYGGWWFAALAFPVVVICLWEFFGMVLPDDRLSRIGGSITGLLVMVLVTFGGGSGAGGLIIPVFSVILPTLWFLIRTGDMNTVASRIGLAALGFLWVGVLGGVTTSLAFLEQGFEWLLLAAVLAFGSDIGGYFVGRFFGRHKLYEKVSPKKTWEGSAGGVVLATGLAFAQRELIGPDIAAEHLAVIAPCGAAFGQLGDLAESMLKRSVGVKDSGTIMPGHGGLFDRIDALLFVGPPLFLYARLVIGAPVEWLGF